VHGDEAEAPAVACNPVTGEKLTLPRGPAAPGGQLLFALGFSPPAGEYKLFRFSFWPDDPNPYNHVPLVTRRMYRLPYPKAQRWHWNPLVDAFEMDGKLCLAVNILLHDSCREIQFWVMSPPDDTHLDVGDDEDDHDDDEDQGYKLYWDLRYSFRVDDPYTAFQMTYGRLARRTATGCCATGTGTPSTSTTLQGAPFRPIPWRTARRATSDCSSRRPLHRRSNVTTTRCFSIGRECTICQSDADGTI
jgi:hypothetical protein